MADARDAKLSTGVFALRAKASCILERLMVRLLRICPRQHLRRYMPVRVAKKQLVVPMPYCRVLLALGPLQANAPPLAGASFEIMLALPTDSFRGCSLRMVVLFMWAILHHDAGCGRS